MLMEWGCTCVEVFFNSDVEESYCTFLYKNYDILSKLNDK